MLLVVGVALFAAIAAYHSVGGESALIGPLVRDRRWRVAGLGREPAELLLRGAWHMTTVAWLALGAAALGLDPALALAVTALVSGAVLLVWLPGHPAWPLFGLVAVLAGRAAGVVTDTWLAAVVGAAAVVALAAAALHVLWVVGRAQASMQAALPHDADGRPTFHPGPALTLLVAGALVALAGLLALAATGERLVVDVGVGLAGLVMVARAVGDGDQVGLSKTDRSTAFAARDDVLYTPLVVLLALGALAALLR